MEASPTPGFLERTPSPPFLRSNLPSLFLFFVLVFLFTIPDHVSPCCLDVLSLLPPSTHVPIPSEVPIIYCTLFCAHLQLTSTCVIPPRTVHQPPHHGHQAGPAPSHLVQMLSVHTSDRRAHDLHMRSKARGWPPTGHSTAARFDPRALRLARILIKTTDR